MRGSKQSQWSIQVGVLHKAACCTALMNFWALGTKQAAVRQTFILLKLFFTTETGRCEKGLIVPTPLLPRCFSNAHEKLHATGTQATDPGHLLPAAPEEFRPAAGQRETQSGFSALCRETGGLPQLPHQHRQPLYHRARSSRPTAPHTGAGIGGGRRQKSAYSTGGNRHRRLQHYDLPQDC